MKDLEESIFELKNRDESKRASALEDVAQRAGPGGLSYLISALEDQSPLVRGIAEEALRSMGAPIAAEALVSRLAGSNASLRNRIGGLLAEMGPAAIPYLAVALKSGHVDARVAAANALGKMEGKEISAPLLEALSDPDESVRYAAAEALGGSHNKEVTPALMQLAAADQWASYAAILSLGRLGAEEALPLLHDMVENDEWRRYPSVLALGDIASPASIPVLLAILQHGDMLLKQAVIRALASIEAKGSAGLLSKVVDDSLRDVIAAAMVSEDSSLRLAGVKCSRWLASPQTTALLAEYVESDDEALAEESMALLSGLAVKEPNEYIRLTSRVPLTPKLVSIAALLLPSRQVYDFLISLLEDKDPAIRQASISVLGKKGQLEAAGAIMAMLDDQEGNVRKAAAAALGQLKAVQAVDKLTPLLADRYSDVRRAAAEALASIGGATVLERLTLFLRSARQELRESSVMALSSLAKDVDMLVAEALQNPDPVTRRLAMRLLFDHPSQEMAVYAVRALVDEDPQVRRLAVETIAKTDFEPGFPAVMSALADRDIWVRFAAIGAAARLAASNPHLRGVVMGRLLGTVEDEDDYLKVAAIRALSTFGDKRVVPVMERLLKASNEDIRVAVCESVSNMKTLFPLEPVESALADPSMRVRVSAVRAAAAIGGQQALDMLRRVAEEDSPAGDLARQAVEDIGAEAA